jgi:glycosyltransferase involved in cell wall biosynthesis
MHTQPVDENGTDLPAVIEAVAPNCNIIFSEKRRPQEELNLIYNLADVTINIANNEGFGLATAESVMAGTPIIVNVTGGLQDQCGFKVEGNVLVADDYIKIGSLHEWRKWEKKAVAGSWATPVWCRAMALAGSVPTPYIWDDRVDVEDVAEAILKVYNTPKEERKANALIGRDFFINEAGLTHTNMCQQLENGIESVFENWKPRERFEVFKIK